MICFEFESLLSEWTKCYLLKRAILGVIAILPTAMWHVRTSPYKDTVKRMNQKVVYFFELQGKQWVTKHWIEILNILLFCYHRWKCKHIIDNFIIWHIHILEVIIFPNISQRTLNLFTPYKKVLFHWFVDNHSKYTIL